MTIETTPTLMTPTFLFQYALEQVKALPEAQQDYVLQILWQQLLTRRQAAVENIEPARHELVRGEVPRGSVDNLLAEVAE